MRLKTITQNISGGESVIILKFERPTVLNQKKRKYDNDGQKSIINDILKT
jgi:hypothetical protein